MMADTDSNQHDASSNVSSSNSDVLAIPVAPESPEEFKSLCDALQRNNPTVTSISTDHLTMIDQGYGFKLGHALQRNTVVSSIVLYLPYLVESRVERIRRDKYKEQNSKLIVERMGLLLHWMEHSCSLRNVELNAGWKEDLILEPIMLALVKHQNILLLSFESPNSSLSLLTPFLQANTSLQTLKIDASAYETDDSDDIIDESARAVGALYQLEVLSLGTSQIDPFLRHLPTSPAFATTLRELKLNFFKPSILWRETGIKFEAGVLCQLLSDRSCRLERLELRNVNLQRRSWTLLSSALLRSNPSSSLRALELYSVHFSRDASSLFMRDIQSNPNVLSMQQQDDHEEPSDPPLHHIVDLRLIRCRFNTPRQGMKLGNILCSSLLQHFTLDMCYLGRRQQHNFFDVLTTRGTAICLQSMHLLNTEWHDLRILAPYSRLAPYIATTVHLRHLTVQCANGDEDEEMPVPNEFLSSLRQNGSLHQVDLSIVRRGERYTPNDANVRRIQTYTMRNRVLPQLMATTSFGSLHATGNANHNGNEAGEAPLAATSAPAFASTPSAGAFPTLGTVAEHAPQMAPNTFLKAFLAASESLVPS